jgi:type IV secretion system protein VirB5
MKKILLIFSLIFLFNSAFADAAPGPQWVIDYKSIDQLVKQIEELNKMNQQLLDTADKVEAVKGNISGLFNYGAMSNDLASWQWTANTWNQEIAELAGGNPSRYQQLMKEYEQTHKTMSKDNYSQGASIERSDIYDQNIKINKAAYAESSQEFNDINKRLNEIHDLTVQIDKADTSKKALDLNSRLLAQVAYLQAEQLRMQTLLNQQYAQTQAAQIDEDTLASQFNSLPKK